VVPRSQNASSDILSKVVGALAHSPHPNNATPCISKSFRRARKTVSNVSPHSRYCVIHDLGGRGFLGSRTLLVPASQVWRNSPASDGAHYTSGPAGTAMWQEFKEFAFKGNAFDLAAGVIIGLAEAFDAWRAAAGIAA
jgi:hypothetical protein